MRALVVYCHPRAESFTAAVCDVVLEELKKVDAEVRVTDLYARDFAPVLTADEHAGYETCPDNCAPVEQDVADLRWCDTLIFVYPTWWYGLPAVLKGWLDRVFLPDVAFLMPSPERKSIHPGLQHIDRLGVFTTCGASWWLTQYIGAPGKKTILRGVGVLCGKVKKTFAAHYLMDSSTPESRKAHLDRVAIKMRRFLA